MRRKWIALYMVGIFILIMTVQYVPLESSTDLFRYYLENGYQDTGAVNRVTGIYLNYRVFDTLFETLLLLISVIGIIYFSKHEGDY